MKKAFTALTLAYPLVLWIFRTHEFFSPIALGLGTFLVIGLMVRLSYGGRLAALGLLLLLLGLMRYLGVRNEARFYPFFMSLSMFFIFLGSRTPEENPMLFGRRLAEDPRLILSLHKSKIIWILGLGLNTLVHLFYLFSGTTESWVAFAGFWSYLWLLFLFIASVLFVHIRMGRLKRQNHEY